MGGCGKHRNYAINDRSARNRSYPPLRDRVIAVNAAHRSMGGSYHPRRGVGSVRGPQSHRQNLSFVDIYNGGMNLFNQGRRAIYSPQARDYATRARGAYGLLTTQAEKDRHMGYYKQARAKASPYEAQARMRYGQGQALYDILGPQHGMRATVKQRKCEAPLRWQVIKAGKPGAPGMCQAVLKPGAYKGRYVNKKEKKRRAVARAKKKTNAGLKSDERRLAVEEVKEVNRGFKGMIDSETGKKFVPIKMSTTKEDANGVLKRKQKSAKVLLSLIEKKMSRPWIDPPKKTRQKAGYECPKGMARNSKNRCTQKQFREDQALYQDFWEKM